MSPISIKWTAAPSAGTSNTSLHGHRRRVTRARRKHSLLGGCFDPLSLWLERVVHEMAPSSVGVRVDPFRSTFTSRLLSVTPRANVELCALQAPVGQCPLLLRASSQLHPLERKFSEKTYRWATSSPSGFRWQGPSCAPRLSRATGPTSATTFCPASETLRFRISHPWSSPPSIVSFWTQGGWAKRGVFRPRPCTTCTPFFTES